MLRNSVFVPNGDQQIPSEVDESLTLPVRLRMVRAWLIDGALGRKEEGLREGRRAVELLPVGKTQSMAWS
jgi:hypothetical protein